MKQASTNTVKCPMNAAGACAPMNQNAIAPARNTLAVVFAEAGSLAAPCPFGAGAGGFAAGLGGAAGTFGAGGGPGMLSSLITVRARMGSSSMLTLMTPAFVFASSSASRERLGAYSVDDSF